MQISSKGLELIKEFEGFKSEPYLCSAGVPTIGYGSTFYKDGRKVRLIDKPISKEEATKLLEYVSETKFEKLVNSCVKVPLTQSQFDSLISFAYNVGDGNFKSSTLLKKVNNKDFIGASEEFAKWVRANGKVSNGLIRRREREQQLFLQG